MSWMNTITRSVSSGVRGLASGVWATVATPFVYTPLRPVTKQAIKGGLWVAHGAHSLVARTREELSDIVAEAEAEAHPESQPQLKVKSGTVAEDTPTNGESAETAVEAGPREAADLTVVKGVGDDYARLLKGADVTSVEALAAQEAESLHGRLVEVNEAHQIVRRVPAEGRIRNWIENAKEHIE